MLRPMQMKDVKAGTVGRGVDGSGEERCMGECGSSFVLFLGLLIYLSVYCYLSLS